MTRTATTTNNNNNLAQLMPFSDAPQGLVVNLDKLPERIVKALMLGDLKELSPDEKLDYYLRVCNSVGLNPLTHPFNYLVLNKKEVLYAKKECAEQLRRIHNIAVSCPVREIQGDCFVVVARAESPKSGRYDESIAAVSILGLRGEALANAYMKAETKAKRRVTLSFCGLGMLDESEVDSIDPKHKEAPKTEPMKLIPPEQQAIMDFEAAVSKCEKYSELDSLWQANKEHIKKLAPHEKKPIMDRVIEKQKFLKEREAQENEKNAGESEPSFA